MGRGAAWRQKIASRNSQATCALCSARAAHCAERSGVYLRLSFGRGVGVAALHRNSASFSYTLHRAPLVGRLVFVPGAGGCLPNRHGVGGFTTKSNHPAASSSQRPFFVLLFFSPPLGREPRTRVLKISASHESARKIELRRRTEPHWAIKQHTDTPIPATRIMLCHVTVAAVASAPP